MKSKIAGSAVGLLLFFSAISYSRTFIQDPKPVPQTTRQVETSNPQADTQPTRTKPSAESKLPDGRASETSASAAALSAATEKAAVSSSEVAAPAQAYMATAYSLRGRTSSGRPASRGLIAADPSVLPLGTRVRLEAGSFSGEYVVGDTGGSVRGRRIDIWTPTANEAVRFGRRVVKLTVLSFGGKRAKSNPVHPRPTISSTTTQSANQQEK